MSTKSGPVPLSLPPYVSEHLKRSPLVLVAAQINFEDVGNLVHGQARSLQKAMDDKYWNSLQTAQQVRFTVTPTGPVQDARSVFQLGSVDSSWNATLSSDNIAIETRSYEGWPGMAEKLKTVAEAVASVLDPSQCLRLGLRYIDQVQMPPQYASWDVLITDSVRGLVNAPLFGDSILGSDQRQLLMLGNDVRCMFHHGLVANDDSTLIGQQYLLDYDVFVETPRAFDPLDISKRSDVLHDCAGALFRASIEPKLYAWLKGDDE